MSSRSMAQPSELFEVMVYRPSFLRNGLSVARELGEKLRQGDLVADCGMENASDPDHTLLPTSVAVSPELTGVHLLEVDQPVCIPHNVELRCVDVAC
jgi:hypothetical protein